MIRLLLRLAMAAVLLWTLPARAVIQGFEVEDDVPPVIEDSTSAASCTIAWLVTDLSTHDTLVARMLVPSAPNERPVDNQMPCPKMVAPRIAARALDACVVRAAEPRTCVYGDMARDFLKRPTANNTAENTSRCASDRASDIGIACARADGEAQLCAVACGNSPEAAIAAAVGRCETKHQLACDLTGSQPVLAPR